MKLNIILESNLHYIEDTIESSIDILDVGVVLELEDGSSVNIQHERVYIKTGISYIDIRFKDMDLGCLPKAIEKLTLKLDCSNKLLDAIKVRIFSAFIFNNGDDIKLDVRGSKVELVGSDEFES